MEILPTEASSSACKSVVYKEFLAEREEILCHKWIESEKAGCDIGFERALVDWSLKYRTAWREKRQK
jgi:hypothetical protein